MLVYAPLGFALLIAGRADLAIAGEIGVCWLAMVPDQDRRVPFVKHRGSTHTVAFALLVGAVLGGVGWILGGRPAAIGAGSLAAFGFAVGTLAVLAHLVGDVLTPAGIRPFWPLSGREFTLSVARADDAVANYGLFALGVFATVALLVVGTGRLPA